MSSIITKTGDKGVTSLGNNIRIPKNSAFVKAYGSVDELQALIMKDMTDCEGVDIIIKDLSDIMAYLSMSVPTIDVDVKVRALEVLMINAEFKGFVLKYDSPRGYALNYLRTFCRRVEREIIDLYSSVVSLMGNYELSENILSCARYLNRLSDYIFYKSLDYAIG